VTAAAESAASYVRINAPATAVACAGLAHRRRNDSHFLEIGQFLATQNLFVNMYLPQEEVLEGVLAAPAAAPGLELAAMTINAPIMTRIVAGREVTLKM
jgi:hypothetical protein